VAANDPAAEAGEEAGNGSGSGGGGGGDGGAQEASGGREPASDGQPEADGYALNDRGFELINAGRPGAAIPVLERAVDALEGSGDITYAYALYNLGHALRLAGRPDEAVPILEARYEIPNQREVVKRELDAARAEAGLTSERPGRGGDGDDDD
ncbi:MAG TPA: tetratricopeptide repeat protein, partial [Solirubrobacterales bacterium]|nr:tetratricopeptide repeat protein [Solirubrobacterales bacterium]